MNNIALDTNIYGLVFCLALEPLNSLKYSVELMPLNAFEDSERDLNIKLFTSFCLDSLTIRCSLFDGKTGIFYKAVQEVKCPR